MHRRWLLVSKKNEWMHDKGHVKNCPLFHTNPEGIEAGKPVPTDPESKSMDLTEAEGDEIPDPPSKPPKKKLKRERSRSSSPAPVVSRTSRTRVTPVKEASLDLREYSKVEFKKAFNNMENLKKDLEDRWKEFVAGQKKLQARLVALEARPGLSEKAKEELKAELLQAMEGAVYGRGAAVGKYEQAGKRIRLDRHGGLKIERHKIVGAKDVLGQTLLLNIEWYYISLKDILNVVL